MWYLLIVLITSPPVFDAGTVLKSFATVEECQPVRDRVGFELAESYPYENDFSVVCDFRASPKILTRHGQREHELYSRQENQSEEVSE